MRLVGFLFILPMTRKLIFKKIFIKFEFKKKEKNDFIEGDFEDIEEDNDKKI